MPFRLSAKGHYAVLLMYDLALADGEVSSLSEVSSRRSVSKGYLEQIAKPLREAGFLVGKRGFGGGYTLGLPSSDITVGDVIRAVEGPITAARCLDKANRPGFCPPDCRPKRVFLRVGRAIDEVLDSITLESLVREKNPEGDATS